MKEKKFDPSKKIDLDEKKSLSDEYYAPGADKGKNARFVPELAQQISKEQEGLKQRDQKTVADFFQRICHMFDREDDYNGVRRIIAQDYLLQRLGDLCYKFSRPDLAKKLLDKLIEKYQQENKQGIVNFLRDKKKQFGL